MITWGINALNHGSSLAVFENGKLLSNEFCYSDTLSYDIVYAGLRQGYPEHIYWYEKPWLKKIRQARAGQWKRVFDLSVLPRKFIDKLGFSDVPLTYTSHHASHAAAGYYTSPFDHCAVVVLDAIGEFECASIWNGQNGKLKKVWSKNYPNSLGLFYSAFTDLVGLTPVKDEYKLQKLAEQGDRRFYYDDVKDYFNGVCSLKYNLHKGVNNWPHAIYDFNHSSIAAAVQRVFEEQINSVMLMAKQLTGADCLVYMGGCAMNNAANNLFQDDWKYIWSLPQPGDPSSSIGAVLYHTKHRQLDYNFGVAKHIQIKV
jgi:carbamoyltransferase